MVKRTVLKEILKQLIEKTERNQINDTDELIQQLIHQLDQFEVQKLTS